MLPGALGKLYALAKEGDDGWSDHTLIAAGIATTIAGGLIVIAAVDCVVSGGVRLHIQ